jgi:hypothetical protein
MRWIKAANLLLSRSFCVSSIGRRFLLDDHIGRTCSTLYTGSIEIE